MAPFQTDRFQRGVSLHINDVLLSAPERIDVLIGKLPELHECLAGPAVDSEFSFGVRCRRILPSHGSFLILVLQHDANAGHAGAGLTVHDLALHLHG